MEQEEKYEKMAVVHPRAAGIDIGSKSNWVAIGQQKEDVKEFGVYTEDLLSICEHLKAHSITSVAMESTGNYWKGLFILLQANGFHVILVNGKYTKNVKGKKTDILDCQWIQKLHSLGLLEGSFIPDNDTEKLKHLCRHRQTLLEDAASYIPKMQKALRQTNIRLDNALNDITGVSGRAIIEAIIEGHRDPNYLVSLIKYRVKKSKEEIIKALTGDWRDEYVFELKQSYELYLFYHQKIQECDKKIEAVLQERIHRDDSDSKQNLSTDSINPKKYNKNDPKINLQELSFRLTDGIDLSAIDGVGHNTLLSILSEVGIDFSKFPTAKQFSSWLRLSPNNKITGGKIISSRTPKGKHRLADALRHVAVVIGYNLKSGALHQFFKRIEFKKGKQAAIAAVARKLSVIIWNMMTKRTPFLPIQEEAYTMQLRAKQIKALNRKIISLKIQPNELALC
jgi:transposase